MSKLWVGLSGGRVLLVVLVVFALVLRVNVIAHFNVNWDEFFYLSQIFDYRRGQLALALQTFHVHFFGWLSAVSTNEVDQVVVARAVMFGLNLVTLWLLYRIARRLTSPTAALFAVFAYLSVSWVIRTGTSFRSDPIATLLVMAAFELLLTPAGGVGRAALAGLSCALAGMITIKTAIFLPSMALLLGAPFADSRLRRETAQRASAALLGGVGGFALLYWLHTLSMNQATARSAAEVVAASLSKTVTRAGFVPQSGALVATLRWDTIFWAFWLAGLAMVVSRSWRGRDRSHWAHVAALALPVGSVLVYRNSFPYFYPFILAPATVLTALAWQSLAERTAPGPGRPLRVATMMLALAWCAGSLILHGIYLPEAMPLKHQRAVVAVVHRMFPVPVPYLDRSSLIASFPQVGFFMTTWGIDAYRQRGIPLLARAIRDQQPPLLIADHPALDLDHAVYPDVPLSRPVLLDADREALARTYVHFWGPIYVAGKHLKMSKGDVPLHFELRITGPYTLEANGPLRLDGQLLRPGESTELSRGSHRISDASTAGPITLLWGERLYRPAQPPPRLPLFLGF